MRKFAIVFSTAVLLSTGSLAFAKDTLKVEPVPLNKHERALVSYNKGLDLLKEGKDIESSVAFHYALEQDPSLVSARVALIKLFKNIGWEDEVDELLSEGLRSSPKNSELLQERSEQYLASKNPEKALSTLLKVEESKRDNNYQALLALTYFDLGLFEMAQQSYIRLIRSDSRDVKWWLGHALCSESLGNNKQALNSYERASQMSGLEHQTILFIQGKLKEVSENIVAQNKRG